MEMVIRKYYNSDSTISYNCELLHDNLYIDDFNIKNSKAFKKILQICNKNSYAIIYSNDDFEVVRRLCSWILCNKIVRLDITRIQKVYDNHMEVMEQINKGKSIDFRYQGIVAF